MPNNLSKGSAFMEFSMLLSPLKIGTMEIKNRFIVPPMGTNFANIDGTVTQQMVDYYTARAKGGFGLIIVEVTAVDPLGKAIICEAGLWEDSQVEGLSRLVKSVHDAGAKIIVQRTADGTALHRRKPASRALARGLSPDGQHSARADGKRSLGHHP
jgi:2,4-dienoyl-CoA reductase-like NADH-dependent reductase (Old Yellow Enzyme family)